MGQTIEILKTTVIDHVLVVDTDRTLAGQDGESYPGVPRTTAASNFPARLAERIFEEDPHVDNVFVMSNTVSVRRAEEWTADTVAAVSRVVSEFFRFYPDSEDALAAQPAEEPAQPAEEPAQPAEEPAQPVEEPAQPAEEPAQPAEEPAQPADEPEEPAERPAD